jgi:DedD protein
MPVATSEDTEITLGTGKMLLLFFGLVALCAVFFAMGFSLGRNSVLKTAIADSAPPSPPPTTAVRPSAAKVTAAPSAPSSEPKENVADSSSAASTENTSATTSNGAASNEPTAPVLNGYYVQVAAVSKQEDADALVDALKRKQYPAFTANSPPDKLFHVQVGPYTDIKDAEAMRAKLVSDGYNPILKK